MAGWWFREAPALLAVLDEGLVCREASSGWRARLGAPGTAAELAVPLSGLFVQEGSARLEARLRASLRRRVALQDMPVSLAGDGAVTEGLLSAWPVRFDSRSTGLCLAATCNSELHRALAELRRLRTMHELILNAAGEGIYGFDTDGNVTFGNAATLEILGWKPEDVLGKRSHDLHHYAQIGRAHV